MFTGHLVPLIFSSFCYQCPQCLPHSSPPLLLSSPLSSPPLLLSLDLPFPTQSIAFLSPSHPISFLLHFHKFTSFLSVHFPGLPHIRYGIINPRPPMPLVLFSPFSFSHAPYHSPFLHFPSLLIHTYHPLNRFSLPSSSQYLTRSSSYSSCFVLSVNVPLALLFSAHRNSVHTVCSRSNYLVWLGLHSDFPQ